MSSISGSSNSILNKIYSALVDLLRLAFRPQSVPANSPTLIWIRRHPILAVISLAYVLSWIGLVPVIRDPSIAIHADLSHANNPSVLIYTFIGVLGCLWAALIVAGAIGGSKGRYDLLCGYLKWRVNFRWYLITLFGPATIFVVAIGSDYLLNGSMPVVPALNLITPSLLSAYAVFVIRYMFGNFEEICWRASVLPRIQAKYSALVSSLFVGLIQGVWHLPFLFVKGHYIQSIGLTAIIVQSIAMGIVATWIYNNTRGSLLMVALFHASNDALSQFQGNDVYLFFIMIIVWCVAAIFLSIIFGVRHLSRKSDSEIEYAIISPENSMSSHRRLGVKTSL